MTKARNLAIASQLLVLSLALGVTGSAAAQEANFSPKTTWELSDARVKANPQIKITVEQEDNEEEIAHVTLQVARGFKLAGDEAVPNGDQLGAGTIVIHAGPGCRPGFEAAPTAPSPEAPVGLREQDRTDEEVDSGVYAVWVLDLPPPIADIPLTITGAPSLGWKIEGDITPSDNTCPPLTLKLNINSQSASGVPLWINPSRVGLKKMRATYTSQNSPATYTEVQVIQITK